MQKVRRRVIGTDRAAAPMFNLKRNRVTDRQTALARNNHMTKDFTVGMLARVTHTAHLLHIFQTAHQAAVTNLPARFRIKWRLVEHSPALLPFGKRLHARAIRHQRKNLPFGHFRVIAKKFGHACIIGDIKPDTRIRSITRTGPCSARLCFLLGHSGLKARNIDLAALLTQRILRQIKRKTKGVIELKRSLARKRNALAQPLNLIVQKLQSAFKRLLEARFLQQKRLFNQRLCVIQLAICSAHLADKRGHQLMHHRVFRPQKMSMTHRTAHNTAQNIATSVI